MSSDVNDGAEGGMASTGGMVRMVTRWAKATA